MTVIYPDHGNNARNDKYTQHLSSYLSQYNITNMAHITNIDSKIEKII